MARKIESGWYMCKYCNKTFHNEVLATACEHGHDIIYVPLTREDIQRLMQFMVTGEQGLLSESLIKTLRKYSTGLRN